MSYERVKGLIVFTCGACDDTFETETDDWNDANEARKESGWIAAREGNDWAHYCPDCRD